MIHEQIEREGSAREVPVIWTYFNNTAIFMSSQKIRLYLS